MKKYTLLNKGFRSISLFFSIVCILGLMQQNQYSLAQRSITVRVAGGYGGLVMTDANTDLKDTYNALKYAKPAIQKPTEITGDFLFSGDIMYKPSAFSFGVSVQTISSKGSLEYSDYSMNFKKNYEVKSFEIEGVARYTFTHTDLIATFYQAGLGYGSASVIRDGVYEDLNHPQYNLISKSDVSGGYFAIHIQAGIELVFKSLRLGASAGYRLADAGVISGPYTENGVNYGDQPIKNVNGQAYKYNFTGVTFGVHLSYEIGL